MKKLPDDIIHYIMCFEDIVTFTRQGLCNKHMRYLFLIHERKLCKAIINKKVIDLGWESSGYGIMMRAIQREIKNNLLIWKLYVHFFRSCSYNSSEYFLCQNNFSAS